MKHLKDLPPFHCFGSMDSADIDLVFFVESMPSTIAECAEKCLVLGEQYAALFKPKKKINCNLATIGKDVLVDVFKGNTDELNNALYLTYYLQPQKYPRFIHRLLARDLDLKFLRSSRSILSLLTKTEQRESIKNALRGDIELKLSVLETIDLSNLNEANTKIKLVEVKKMLAFQIGQTLALFYRREVYTKSDIALIFPELKPYLDREKDTDFTVLQSFLGQFNAALKDIMPTIKSQFEYKYPFKYVE
jgi:hypothetical protein